MRALVAGYGFVGRHLADFLADAGHEVVAADRAPAGPECRGFDTRHAPDMAGEFDAVFCLAGVSDAAYAEANPVEAYECNVLGTLRLLKATEGARFVFASSAVVYGGGSPAGKPIGEDARLEPIGTYGETKVAAERLVRALRPRDHAVLRLFNLYGPGQAPRYIVPQLATQAARRGRLQVRNGRTERDFVHVRDACAAMEAVATLPGPAALTANLGSGRARSVASVAADVAQACGGLPVEELGEAQDPLTAPRLQADGGRLAALGWRPAVAWEAGLRETLKAYGAPVR